MKTRARSSNVAGLLGLVLVVMGLALIVWIFSSINELHARLAVLSPKLASAVMVGIFVVLVAILVVGTRFWLVSRRPALSIPDHAVRSDPVGAADQTLKATEQQLALVSDEVARKALAEELDEVAGDFAQRRFSVVVFGTGSAGKTSVINALLGKKTGQTDPITGTTKDREEHTYALDGFGQGTLRLIDTPGLSEFGVAGAMREERARELAAQADLLLFVVDQDLRDIEFKPLAELARLGKRSILVLNKQDLYRPEDVEAVLRRLHERMGGVAKADSVVVCAAAPASVTVRDTSGTHQENRPADVDALAERLAEVLQSEGMNLLAENVLLRAKRVSDKAREAIHAARVVQAGRVVSKFTWTTAGVLFVNPIPGLSVLAAAAINYQMIAEIAKCFGVEIRMDAAKRMARELAQVMIKMGIVGVATEIMGKALKASVVGYVAGGTIEALAGAYLTKLAGDAFTEYFAHDQNWGEGGMQGAIERKFRMQRQGEFIAAFIKEATRKILNQATVPQSHEATKRN